MHPSPLADGAGLFRQYQVRNEIIAHSNVLNFHSHASFSSVRLFYRKIEMQSNVPPCKVYYIDVTNLKNFMTLLHVSSHQYRVQARQVSITCRACPYSHQHRIPVDFHASTIVRGQNHAVFPPKKVSAGIIPYS